RRARRIMPGITARGGRPGRRTLAMTQGTSRPEAARLDDFIDAYESAQVRHGAADLADFLPDLDHPLYGTVLRELVRVDLEYAWQRGRPKPLDHYRAAFPDLFARPDDVRQVAFEEFRLRAQAGQAPSPQEYARRYGVDTAGWQATRDDRGRGNGTAREPAADSELSRVAFAYRGLRSKYG